jgi:heme oxygenase
MSALPPKADIAERDHHIRFVPKQDVVTTKLWRAYTEVLKTVRDASKAAAKVASGRELGFDRLPQAIRPG